MRISRLRLHDFRGWAELDLRPRTHVLLAGVPRAGRTDILLALARLLDPAFIRVQPSVADVRHQRLSAGSEGSTDGPATAGSGDNGDIATAPDVVVTATDDNSVPGPPVDGQAIASYGEVVATLVELDPELEQLCDGFLEPLDDEGQIDETGNAAPDAPVGVRLGYRVSYDATADSLEHVVFFPVRSNPTTGQYQRVPTAVRRALPVVVLNSQRPLQLRAEGVLRRLVTDRDAEAASAAFHALEQAVAAAADGLAADATIAATVDAVLQAGGLAGHLADTAPTSAGVRFRPEDGSLSALLRAVQPAVDLDEAGLLALPNHGSTAVAVLAAAEALLLAASVDGAVVLGDDFGDGLDAATAEHLAAVLRARTAQVWLTTRRPEVARAFDPSELVRLSRTSGIRTHHLLPRPTDKKEIALRRLLHSQLLPALTAPVVAITEGPHDLTTFTSADRHRAATTLPLAAAGVRLISADNGSGGGTSQIPRVATLARTMGFRVIALIDHDPEKASAALLTEIDTACDVVVRLPESMAIERALMAGVSAATVRAAASVLAAYGIPDPTLNVTDADLPQTLTHLLHRRGLHEQLLEALIDELGSVPPVLNAVLNAVASAAAVNYAGPKRVDLTAPPTAASPS